MSSLLPLLLAFAAAATPPAAKAREAAQALCDADAECEGWDCYRRARCRTVDDAPFEAPKGSPTLVLHAERPSDGEGNIVQDRYFRWDGSTLVPLFTVESDSGGDGPHTSVSRTLVVCREQAKGVPQLDLRVTTTEVRSPAEPDGDWVSDSSHDVQRLVWDGSRFVKTGAIEPCAELPRPPPWLASARASSTLVEKSLPRDYYRAENAADGDPATAWAEAAKGPGAGEWLELRLSDLTFLAEVRLLAGCGVSAKLWKSNQRLKAVTLVFSDGEAQQARLADTGFGEFASIVVRRSKPTTSVRIVVGEVYPARSEDACISEVELVRR